MRGFVYTVVRDGEEHELEVVEVRRAQPIRGIPAKWAIDSIDGRAPWASDIELTDAEIAEIDEEFA